MVMLQSAVMASSGSSTSCRPSSLTLLAQPFQGSMHTKLPNDIYIAKLHDYAQQMSGRKLRFIKLDKEPVIGCINWIFRQYK